MGLKVDHVVLWVEDPLQSVAFYEEVLGLTGERVEDFRDNRVPFPSVRVSASTLLDLMPKRMAPMLNALGNQMGLAVAAAGHPVNHVCFAMTRDEYRALEERVRARGVEPFSMTNMFGARGQAPEAFYFFDPDGNVLEARWYADQ